MALQSPAESDAPLISTVHSNGPASVLMRSRRALLLGLMGLSGCATWNRSDDDERSSRAKHDNAGDEALGAAKPATGQGVRNAAVPTHEIPLFSRSRLGQLPDGWQPWIIHPRKIRTRYNVTELDGVRVLQARARSSASGLLAPLQADPNRYRRLQWRWRTEAVLHEADNSDPAREDAPVRVVLAFEGDKDSLPVRDRLFFERVKLLAGVDMPYATLMYIWAARKEVDTVVPNPHTARVRKIVATTGADRVGQWVDIDRDIVEDFRTAYGEPPGRLLGVSVMSDTDNTQGDVTAYYGDIRLIGA